jgi:nucleotide-binding universal stress UspA family protein
LEGRAAKEVKSGARQSAAKVVADKAEPDPEKVHLIELAQKPQAEADAPADIIRAEAEKGYDMLLIGVEQCCEADGGFSPLVSGLAQEFSGNIALLTHTDDATLALRRGDGLLVAANGTEISRDAAEIAFALARATGVGVTAVYAATGDHKRRTRRREEDLLKDVAGLAERYGVPLKSRIAGNSDAAKAILKEADRHSLIVMGVSARPGDDLFFGATATRVLAATKKPILFLARKAAATKTPEKTAG